MQKKKSRKNLRKKSVYENIKRNKKKLKSSNIQINKSTHLLKQNSFSNLYRNSNLKKAMRFNNILNQGYFCNEKENIVIDGLKRKSKMIKKNQNEDFLKLSKTFKQKNIKKLKEDNFKKKIFHKKNNKKLCHFRKISENNLNNIYLNEKSLKSASLDSQNFMILQWKSKEKNKLKIQKKKNFTEKKIIGSKTKLEKRKSISKKNNYFHDKNSTNNTKNLASKIRLIKKSFKNKYIKRYSQNRKSLNKFKVSFKNQIFNQINKSTNFNTDRKISKNTKNKKSLVNMKVKKKKHLKSLSISKNNNLNFLNCEKKRKNPKKKICTITTIKSAKTKEPFININFEKTKNIYFDLNNKNKKKKKKKKPNCTKKNAEPKKAKIK